METTIPSQLLLGGPRLSLFLRSLVILVHSQREFLVVLPFLVLIVADLRLVVSCISRANARSENLMYLSG